MGDRAPKLGMIVFAGICAAVLLLFHVVPTGFVPDEDQGYLVAVVNMPKVQA